MANIILVDDHVLLRNGLAGLVRNLGHNVLFEANNGHDFMQKLDATVLPDIVLMDINMPEADGYESTLWLKQHHPDIKVLALSMYDDEKAIIRMLKCGAKGYILKDSDPAELEQAISDVLKKGFYYSELVSGKIVSAMGREEDVLNNSAKKNLLNDRETEFLKYSCSELTYKEIADKMFISPRTVDGYRDALFEKLKVKTRVGLAMYAIRIGLVNV